MISGSGSEPIFGPYRPFPNEAGRNWRQEFLELPTMVALLALPRGGQVLEVGCGRGVALPGLARRLAPRRLVGLDLDPTLLEVARQTTADIATVELHHGDVRSLPFPDRSFDVVVDFGTSYHIDRPAQALREIARVLRPNGVFVVETKLAQWLSHPGRSAGRFLPWGLVPELVRRRHAGLWQSRRRNA